MPIIVGGKLCSGEEMSNKMAVKDFVAPVKVVYDLKELDSISDFSIIYGNRLPQIVQFSQGYLGYDDLHTISPEDYIIHGTISQKRIVVQGPFDMRFSLPLDVADELVLYRNKSKSPYKLSQIASKPGWNIENTYKVRFKSDLPIGFSQDSSIKMPFSQLDAMPVVDCYEEQYLTASVLTNRGGMPDSYMLMPVYIPLSLRVASGFTGMSQQDFHARLQTYKKNVNHQAVHALELNKAIVVMSNTSEEYCYIEPRYVEREFSEALLKKIEVLIGKSKTMKAPKVPKRIPSTKSNPIKKSRPPVPVPVPQQPTVTKDTISSDDEILSDDSYDYIPSELIDQIVKPHKEKELARSGESNKNIINKEEYSLVSKQKSFDKKLPDKILIKEEAKDKHKRQNLVKMNSQEDTDNTSYEAIDTPENEEDDIYNHMDAYRVLNTLSNKIYAMGVIEVGHMLRALKIEHAIEPFQEHTIDGKILCDLDDEILTNDFNFSRLQLKKFRKFMKGWVPKEE